jgi:hypothetical protein
MLKPKQFCIIIYVNVCVKRVYPLKANNNILFRYGKIPESKFSVPWSSFRWSNKAFKSPAAIHFAVNKNKQFGILKIWMLTRTSMLRLIHLRNRKIMDEDTTRRTHVLANCSQKTTLVWTPSYTSGGKTNP